MGKKLRLSHGVPTHIITNKKKFHGGPPTPTFFTTPPLPPPFLPFFSQYMGFVHHLPLLPHTSSHVFKILNCNYELILFSVRGLFRILMLERQWYYLRSFLYTLIKKNLYIIFYRKLVTLLFDLRKILVTPFTK